MHHYEGAAGAEALVSLAFGDGDVRDFRQGRGEGRRGDPMCFSA